MNAATSKLAVAAFLFLFMFAGVIGFLVMIALLTAFSTSTTSTISNKADKPASTTEVSDDKKKLEPYEITFAYIRFLWGRAERFGIN
ncbi:hypothetical protein ACFSTH_12910 [Paenibacillus yanchengensis]|uniref:Uncharacterized protein n=1 Tax=Paenibacillus yanchengensis TaxID=2035833 RepID=A0ABW4YPH0_9BACL